MDTAPLTPPVTSPTPQTPRPDNVRLAFFGFLGFVGILLVVTLGVSIYRVYARTAADNFTLTVASALRLPALKVNGDAVLYTDFVEDLKAIRLFRAFSQENGGQGASMTDEQLTDQVLQRLASNKLVARLAKEYNVTVENTDIDVIKKQLMDQFKNEDAINQELKKRYGWDMKTYETRVMYPYVLQGKLNDAIAADPKAHEEARTTAAKVLAEINAGKNFSDAAKEYGQDGTAQSGGDLGWFSKGDMVPQFEAAAFALKPGEISKEPVETPYGFHLIQLVEKKAVKSKDAAGKAISTEQVHARHILFAFPSLDKLLTEAIKNAKINLYLKVHNPFITATPVVPGEPSDSSSTPQ